MVMRWAAPNRGEAVSVVPFPRKQQRLNININRQTEDGLREVAEAEGIENTWTDASS